MTLTPEFIARLKADRAGMTCEQLRHAIREYTTELQTRACMQAVPVDKVEDEEYG